MSESSIFGLLRIIIIESDGISPKEAQDISRILKDNGVMECSIYKDSNIALSNFTKKQFLDEFPNQIHCIVSKTISFPFYSLAAFDFLIPVVNPSWIEHCLKFKRLMRTTCYSPNDKHFLKDCYIYVSKHSLNMVEYQLFCAIITSLGGTCMDYLSTKATHIVTWNKEDLAIKAMQKFEKYKVKFLVPNWLVDCLCQMEHVKETEYLIDVSKQPEELESKVDQLWKRTLSGVDLWKSQGTFKLGKRIVLGDDLSLPGPCYKFFLSWVKRCLGGSIVIGCDFEQLSEEIADIYIGYSVKSSPLDAIKTKGLLPANISWIFYTWQIEELVDPRSKLLLSPLRESIFSKDELKVTFTNYYGEQRYYIQQLTEALGGVCSTELTKKNTHLISSIASGKKFQAAASWDSCITVNHLWLESCYKYGKKLDPGERVFQEFPVQAGLLKSLGQMPLEDNFQVFREVVIEKGEVLDINEEEKVNETILEPTKNPIEGQSTVASENNPETTLRNPVAHLSNGGEDNYLHPEITDVSSHAENNGLIGEESKIDNAVKTELMLEELERTMKTGKRNKNIIETPLSSRECSSVPFDQSTNGSTPLSASKRKAKEKAEEKLQQDMESLNEYQRGSKRKRTPDLLPEEIKELKKHKALDLRAAELIASLNLSHKPYRIKAAVTHCHENLSEFDLALLSKVGITITLEIESNTNTIIAPKKSRTAKFLKSLSLKPLKYALQPSFISDVLSSIHKGRWQVLDIKQYYIADIDPEVLKRTKLPTKVFERAGLTQVNLSDDIPGGFDLVAGILKSHGMMEVKPLRKKFTIVDIAVNNDKKSPTDYVLIATKASVAKKFSNCIKGAHPDKRIFVVEWNWCVKSIFNLDIDMSDREYVILNK